MNYIVTAQSIVGTQRIAKAVNAASKNDALRSMAKELFDAGYYPISVNLAEQQ